MSCIKSIPLYTQTTDVDHRNLTLGTVVYSESSTLLESSAWIEKQQLTGLSLGHE